MSLQKQQIRVLYTFPNKLGAERICYTAWQQVNGLAAAGADLLVFPGVLEKPVPAGVRVRPTLAWGKLRISYRLVGSMRACALHDGVVARRIEKFGDAIDIIHAWPLGALETLKTAARLGIPTVLERPNANTRFAMEVVRRECERLGITLPRDHEHAYNEEKLQKEEKEYELADRLLCPSDFVVKSFLDKGYSPEKLVRHSYGFDEKVYHPNGRSHDSRGGLSLLFVGGCAPRKGLHYALEAWLRSPAHRDGTFLIAGSFVEGYAEKLSPLLAHPSIRVLGHRDDVPDLMRKADILLLPSIEEGSALVTSEARGSGCVLLVSEAAGAICKHNENALVHRVGDVEALTNQITLLHRDRGLLAKLRTESLKTVHEITWTLAGARLIDTYREVIAACGRRRSSVSL